MIGLLSFRKTQLNLLPDYTPRSGEAVQVCSVQKQAPRFQKALLQSHRELWDSQALRQTNLTSYNLRARSQCEATYSQCCSAVLECIAGTVSSWWAGRSFYCRSTPASYSSAFVRWKLGPLHRHLWSFFQLHAWNIKVKNFHTASFHVLLNGCEKVQ